VLRLLSAALLSLACSACGAVTTQVLAAGPGTAGDPHLLDDAIRGAHMAGYQAMRIDAERGRFEVVARSDRSGLTRFTIQCFREGWVTIVPSDGPVTRVEGAIRVPARLRDEHGRLAAEIQRMIEVRP
jgi:hypothetical protein